MAKERITLVSDDVKRQLDLESQIRAGLITPDSFTTLSAEDQTEVNNILFKIASEQVEPNQGTSALEFILFGFMRVMMKKIQGLSLNTQDKKVEESLNRIMARHDITNQDVDMSQWLFDYMGYAELKSNEFLKNREEHIARKQQVTGRV